MPQPPELERQERVLNILHNLEGTEPLKRLFWSELSYDRVNQSIPRRALGEGAAAVLADDPLLLASAADDFQVIYSRLSSPKLLMTPERPVVSRLLQDHPYALFVFSNSSQDRWHFLNVKYDGDVAKRRLFRRITVGPEERLRTACERLSMLDLATIGAGVSGLSPLDVQTRHDEAFDVEPVTKEFFATYREIFEQVEGQIRGIHNAEKKRLFTQRLFNRLMFVAFIQKKGWLTFGEDRDYLDALWRGYTKEKDRTGNFYRDRLKLLFFSGLSTATESGIADINRGGFLKSLIGQVPYLNGGLFEEDEDDNGAGITVPDSAVKSVIQELFNRFNFTVTESTPLDVEVAVDPEMLGKIFEELVTGRHETGSYYTPKPVVSFMCREALKGCLETQLPAEQKEAIEQFVDEHKPDGIHDAEAALDALRRIKVCDPACGSGAYLLGMLHELLDLRAALFHSKQVDAVSVYQRKLEIIERNVYGVDIDPFAINIARLRLWLSLGVEFEGDNPPPLPNLDYKVEVGDSLTAPDPSGGLEQGFRKTLIDEFLALKGKYLTAHGGEKMVLRDKIAKARADIASWAHGGAAVQGFDWPVEFAEVFVAGGFDVVLANPPYVRADAQFRHVESEAERQAAVFKWQDYRAKLVASGIYRTLYEKWDLYLPFLERGHQLLRCEGQMAFIISDAYNTAKYARKSHDFFAANSQIERIDFCTDIPLFDAGVSNTIVHFSNSKPADRHQPVRVRRWGKGRDDFEQNAEPLSSAPQRECGAAVFRADRAVEPQFEGCVELGHVCYISYGVAVSSDEKGCRGQFVTGDVLSEVRDRLHPKPYTEGKDLVRWWVRRIRFLEWGTRRAPAKFRRKTFPELHEAKEKLLALRISGDRVVVAYDDRKLYSNHTAVTFVPWHYLAGVRNSSIKKRARYHDELKPSEVGLVLLREQLEELSRQFLARYLLAIMNSGFSKRWLAKRRRSKTDIYPDDWKQLPVVRIDIERQGEFVRLADAIIGHFQKQGCPLPPRAAELVAELERELDERVEALYKNAAVQAVGVTC